MVVILVILEVDYGGDFVVLKVVDGGDFGDFGDFGVVDKNVEDATQNWFSLRQTSAAQNMQTFQSENFQLANLCANLPIDMQIKPLTELNLTTYLFSF